MPSIDKCIGTRLLILTARKHEHRFLLISPFFLKALVGGMQALIIVAIVLVFQTTEEGGGAREEGLCFAGVPEGNVAAD